MIFTNRELRDCAEREARFRRRVYARFVSQGRYTADNAMREIAMMEAIVAHFDALAAKDEPSSPFGEPQWACD
jgi:hypothetical protein